MPTYTVQSPSGQSLTIEGDAPPTEKELDEIFASVAPAETKAPVVSKEEVPHPARLGAEGGLLAGQVPGQNLGDSLSINPEAVANMGIRAAGPTIGQYAGTLTGPAAPVAVPVLGGLGGAVSEYVALLREGKPVTLGKIIGAATSGAIPGAQMAGAGAKAVAKEGAKLAAGELASATAESAIDRGELPSATEATVRTAGAFGGAALSKVMSKVASQTSEEALNSVRDQSFRDVRKWGIVVPPSEVGKGSDTLASFGGKAATTQEAAKRNQFGWQKAVREELGLSPGALPIRKTELLELRDAAAAPYREIQTIQTEAKAQLEERLAALAKESDPHAAAMAAEEPAIKESISILSTLAAADVNALKEARYAAQRARTAFQAGDPNAYEPWQKAKANAEKIEEAIDRAAASLKDDTLLKRLRESRQKIAKTYAVEEAVNPGNGFVDPLTFGRQLVNGEPLSGNLEKIAKFQLAFRREAVEAGRVPAPGVGNVGAMATTGMASRGDVPGLVGAAVNATAGRAVRPFLLSDFVQDAMLSPQERQNFSAVMARFLAEESAQELASGE